MTIKTNVKISKTLARSKKHDLNDLKQSFQVYVQIERLTVTYRIISINNKYQNNILEWFWITFKHSRDIILTPFSKTLSELPF